VADKFVTVATFNLPYEGELARNLLQNEGIESFLTGNLTADVLSSNLGLGDQVRLQVHDRDARRAASILAAHQASLDDDWEDKAEHDPDVWVCSLCGSPISNSLSACYACQTPREGIRTDRPPALTDIQHAPAAPPPPDPVQKRDEVMAAEGLSLAPAAPGTSPTEPASDEEEAFPEVSDGDDMARRAFLAAILGCAGVVFLLPVSWYFLARVMFFQGELSRGALHRFYLALVLSCGGAMLWLGAFTWLRH
jgi:hypothetical protein